MALYEHVFLARQDLAQAQVDALAEAATKIVEDHKGKVVKTVLARKEHVLVKSHVFSSMLADR